MRGRRTVLLASLLLASACSSRRVEMKMGVEVLSEPAGAEIRYRGKRVGETPRSFRIASYEDLGSIDVVRADAEVVEKRIRIVSPDHLQVVFRHGKGSSAIARRLGLTRVLIFEYTEKVTFESEKYELAGAALPILKKQAEILNVYFPKADVHVCGFTDATGTDELNDRLSLQRAEAVRDVLVREGVAGARLEAQGFGKEFENAPNDTPEGRAQNRRTEVILPQ